MNSTREKTSLPVTQVKYIWLVGRNTRRCTSDTYVSAFTNFFAFFFFFTLNSRRLGKSESLVTGCFGSIFGDIGIGSYSSIFESNLLMIFVLVVWLLASLFCFINLVDSFFYYIYIYFSTIIDSYSLFIFSVI